MDLKKGLFSAVAAACLSCTAAVAQEPTLNIYNDNMSTSFEKLSDNGAWAVGYAKSTIDELGYSYPTLYNVKTREVTRLYTDKEVSKIATMMACDVTDDGQKVIGQYNGRPALWSKDKGGWTLLKYNVSGYNSGCGNAITPDGKYAVGTVTADNWNEAIVVWDLTGAEPVDITPANLPKPISMSGTLQDFQQVRACDISADGKKFIGLVAFSYMGEQWTFVYDMVAKTWQAIGYDVAENGDGYKFTATDTGYLHIEGGTFRPGSNEVYGDAWLAATDGEGIYSYNMDTRKTSIVADSEGKLFGGVDSEGLVYASTPAGVPLRNWEVKCGNYWYDFKVLYRQLWKKDWQNDILQDDYGYTGTFSDISTDGLLIVANEYTNKPYDTYFIELAKPLSELCPTVNLLDNYVVSPVNNSAFAILKEVKVMFDRNIGVVDNSFNKVNLVDEQGNVVANSVQLSVDAGDSRILNVTFRNRRLEVGKKYTVVIPAGVVYVAGDAARTNSEIRVTYTGRPQAPVAPVTIAPADGLSIEKINASTNPVTVTFDAQIAPVEEGGKMYLYRMDEDNNREEIALLSGSIEGNTLSVYPVMEQRLAMGSNYQVVIEANSVSDISGADPNEEIVINYVGDYIPKFDPRKPFEDNFNEGISGEKWMTYDGDGLEPAEEPASWGFTKEMPWWLARDENTATDMAAASHSMYSPVGKSDDWMVTNQIYINDDTALLTFKSQSYKKDCTDRLKVYIYATDDVYTALTPTIVDRFRYNGDLVYDEVESPGASEDKMAGDWKENTIKLDKYAGKYIYIAFVNDNRNQSAIFVDDVVVSRDVKYILANLTPDTQLAKDEVTVKGLLTIESKTETFKGYTLTLLDGEGKTVSTISEPEKELKLGDKVEFSFPEPLKLTVGKEEKYTIDLKLGDLTEKLAGTVRNLAVETTKRVVIEEFTGQTCPNCPLGHAAFDILEKDFGDKVIPVAIHTYTGDNFATPQAMKLTQFLGLSSAPTGRVNRRPVSSPMDVDSSGKYIYKDNGLWYDYVVSELSEYAEADVYINDFSFDGENYNVDVDVTYALDMENLNANIFTVICENGLNGTQDNNRASVEDPALGDWGKGGKYGQSSVPYVYDHVVRTWAGTTCNGTGGYIPANVTGGQAYNAKISVPNISRINDPKKTSAVVMLIDAGTGLVINANYALLGASSGVDGMQANTGAVAYTEDGNVVVNAGSLTVADVYAVDGTTLASRQGEGRFSIDLNGYTGVVIVTLRNEAGSKAVKLIVK